MQNLNALILGIVEGLTEFLPISSTGHMILATSFLGINLQDGEFWSNFLIIIQLGSILAVLFVFYRRLLQGFKLWFKLALAFLPTGIIGLLLYNFIKDLFNGYVVVFMLIFGGFVFIALELKHKGKNYSINSLDEVGFKQAFFIGLIQCLAMIPGTSRSGASIVGGLLLGLNRKVATEFSFLLAIPTMFVASAYSVYKNPFILQNESALTPLIIGFLAAFVVAIFAIKFFLKFVAKFNFLAFGIYRIILGLLFFYLYGFGILELNLS